MEISKGRGASPHTSRGGRRGSSVATAQMLSPAGSDSWGGRFLCQPRPSEKGYLKLKAKGNVTFMLSKDSKLKHQAQSITLVSIY